VPPQPAPWDDLPDAPPGAPAAPVTPIPKQPSEVTIDPNTGRPLVQFHGAGGKGAPLAPWLDLPDQPPPPSPPSREVGGAEAAWTGLKSGLSFGFEPEYQGMAEAGKEVISQHLPDWIKKEDLHYLPSPILAHIGAAKRLWDWTTGHDDPEVVAAAERGRKFAQETVDLSGEQHPWPFYGGVIVGSLALPGFGPELAGARALGTGARIAAEGAPALERIATGAAQGSIYGGLSGAGEATSRGESPLEVAKSTAKGAVMGAGVGGALHGAVGPSEAPMVPTAGQRAAATAEDLGAPLPRGVASDRPIVQQATAAAQSLPITGAVVRRRVQATQRAAGEHIEDISQQMTRGAAGRTTAAADLQRGVEGVIDRNVARQDANYARLRAMLDLGGETEMHAMPRTRAALDQVAHRRLQSGMEAPERGLERFRNLQDTASFNGAQRLRTWARNQTRPTEDNPGFDAGDYRAITGAMGADMRQMAADSARAAGNHPGRAVAEFERADAEFGRLAEQNKILRRLADLPGEGIVGKLQGAAQIKGGDARLLQQLRRQMAPQEFEQLGGTILGELGQRAPQGEFSLQTFTTGWNKISDAAKAAMFSPQHQHDIDEIVHMGEHIHRALETTNRSHTGDTLIGFEMAKTIGELAVAAGAGWLSAGEIAAGLSTTIGVPALAMILASPARTASTRAWLRAYNGAISDPTPARTAVFKVATRNLGHTLGVPPEAIAKVAEDATPPPKQQVQVPIR
jgi:hypothetical protein